MIFMRPPAVEAEAMSLGTLALRLRRCTWICKHLYLWVLFLSLFVGFVNFFLGSRYVIFGLHAAPGFANIFILMFTGHILITMTKIYLSLYIWWSFQVVMKSFYLCVPCAGYCRNEVFEFTSSFAPWFWEFLFSFACGAYLFECLHLCIYSFLYIKIQYDAKSVKELPKCSKVSKHNWMFIHQDTKWCCPNMWVNCPIFKMMLSKSENELIKCSNSRQN